MMINKDNNIQEATDRDYLVSTLVYLLSDDTEDVESAREALLDYLLEYKIVETDNRELTQALNEATQTTDEDFIRNLIAEIETAEDIYTTLADNTTEWDSNPHETSHNTF
jgi:predicted nucleic acid-binding protein